MADDPQARFVFSRYAWMRRDASTVVIESPLTHLRVRVNDPRVGALLAAMHGPSPVGELAAVSGLTMDETRLVLQALMHIGAVRRHGVAGQEDIESDVPITWSFHDLLFHTRSRSGRSPVRYGKTGLGTVPEAGPPLPNDIVLPPVDFEHFEKSDPPLAAAMAARRSVRNFTGGSVQLSQLSDLLGRVMGQSPRQPGSTRMYPAGGGVYETDAVILAFDVQGLAPGAYIYRPNEHALRPLQGEPEALARLGQRAAAGAGQPPEATPPALVVFTARFPALASHYDGIAYSLMLKHVGVLIGFFSLNAPTVGLSAVPIGLGDSDDFATATGLPYFRQGSIGEVALSQLHV